MKIFLIKIVLVFIILLPLTILSRRWDTSIKPVVVIIAAIVGLVY